LASGVLATNTAYAQKEWYPGEGLQEGLLVKYTVSFIDYKQGEPFALTLWFESKDDKGNWKVFAIVEDKGQVVTSDVILSSLNLTPVGFDVTPEFRPYRSAMKESIGWLASYASKADPKPLDSGTWGVIAAIGGGGIVVGPAGAESITIAGKSWDASKISFHYGEDSTIWVSDEFPLPLKAKVFALTIEKPIPVMFEFEMTEMSISMQRPVPPQSEVRIPKSPLSKPTTSGSFTVDLYWKPEKIETNNPVTFGVVIFDNRGSIVKDFLYAMTITDATGTVLGQSALGNRFLFTGRELDAETSLYYYRARYYNPTIGRFLQRDPVGYSAGLNLYSYVDNNPVNWVDPFGLEKKRSGRESETTTILLPGIYPGGPRFVHQEPGGRRYWSYSARPTPAPGPSPLGSGVTAVGNYYNDPGRILRHGGRVTTEVGYPGPGRLMGLGGLVLEPGGPGEIVGIAAGGMLGAAAGRYVGATIGGIGGPIGGIGGAFIGGTFFGWVGSWFDSPYEGTAE